MSIYMTEAEQLEVIKKWWQRYNNLITVLLSVFLLLIAGYKYWNWHQEKISQQASSTYENLMLTFSNQNNKGVRAYANQLLKDYGDTVYADTARLTLAKLFISRENYSKAQKELEYVALHSETPVLRDIANIRLARLLAANKSYDKALALLAKVDNSAYTPLINELRGDIYAATGQYQAAVASYRKAVSAVKIDGMGNLFLEMKTNELAAMTQAVSTSDGKPQSA